MNPRTKVQVTVELSLTDVGGDVSRGMPLLCEMIENSLKEAPLFCNMQKDLSVIGWQIK